MSKNLAILKELGEAMKIPADKLKAIFEDKDGNALTEDNVDYTALGKALKDGYLESLSTVSKNLTFDKKKTQEDAYKAAERKIKTEVETLVKEKFNLSDEDGDKIEDLIEVAVTKVSTSAGSKKGDLTDNDIQKHAAYVRMENQYKKQIKDLTETHTQQLSEIENTYKKEKVFGGVSEKGLQLFDSLKPVLSADGEKAKGQRALVSKLLSEFEYEEVEGQIVISKDGKILTDERGDKLSLDVHVKNVTTPYFDFQVAEPKTAPNGGGDGNSKKPDGDTGKKMTYTGTLPKSKQEVISMVNDEKISLEHRIEIQEWADAQGEALAAQ